MQEGKNPGQWQSSRKWNIIVRLSRGNGMVAEWLGWRKLLLESHIYSAQSQGLQSYILHMMTCWIKFLTRCNERAELIPTRPPSLWWAANKVKCSPLPVQGHKIHSGTPGVVQICSFFIGVAKRAWFQSYTLFMHAEIARAAAALNLDLTILAVLWAF